jgi:hypothetical protein
MITEQSELNFTTPERPDAHDIASLADFLFERGQCWTTAREISAALKFSDRKIRSLASHSAGEILSGPGCPGYRHVSHSTPEDVAEIVARLRHQAKAMDDRASKILKSFHSAPHMRTFHKTSVT